MKKIIRSVLAATLCCLILCGAPAYGTAGVPEGTDAVRIDVPSGTVFFDGHAYKIYADSMTWDEAELYCEGLGGHLLTINSADEQEFVDMALLPQETTKYMHWIGLYDDGTNENWRWVTDEDVVFTNWNPGEPTDNFQDKAAVLDNGKWLDNPGDGFSAPWSLDNTGFICEWEMTVKKGDVDFDGKITSADARLALRASVSLENYTEGSLRYNVADVDCDGKITSSDARLILRGSVGLEDPSSWGQVSILPQ